MKRFIVLMYDPSDDEVQRFQTDDLDALVKSLEEYDLGMSINGGLDDNDVTTIVSELETAGVWNGGDDSRILFMINTMELSE